MMKMNKITPSLLMAAAALICVAPLISQTAEKKDAPAPQKKGKAPPLPGAGSGGNTAHATINGVVGPNRNQGGMITISYGRPTAVHPRTGGEPRKIWGGLVKWDVPDRLGADEATSFMNEYPIEIAGTTVPVGAYTLYIVPSEKGTSKLAFSKHISKWGVPVDDKQDFARFDLQKETLNETVDQLTLSIENVPQGSMNGVLKIKWEKTQFSLPFTLKR